MSNEMNERTIKPGQILTGSLFNEPMRVETVRQNGPDTWSLGLVGTQSERFRSVTLTSRDIDSLTVLDATSTICAAMLLQASGQANALRTPLKAEQDRGPDFLRLANALSALYPKDSEEKRLLDAMLLAMPR